MGNLGLLLCWLVIGGVIALECTIAVWAVASSCHRLPRAVVVWAAVVLLIPIRAYLPAMFFLMTAVTTCGIVAVIRCWLPSPLPGVGGARPGWRFQIADLVVLTLLVATTIAVARYLRVPGVAAYIAFALLGVPLAPILACSQLAVAGPARLRMAFATCLAIVASAAMLARGDVIHLMELPIPFGLHSYRTDHYPVVLQLLLIACLIACVAVVVGLIVNLRDKSSPAWRRGAYILALICTTALGVLLVIRFIDELWLTEVPELGSQLFWVAVHVLPLSCLAVLGGLVTWLTRIDWTTQHAGPQRKARALATGAAVVAIVPACWLYWQMVRPLPFPPRPAAGVNHYERIIAISQELGEKYSTSLGAADPLLDELVVLLSAPNYIPTKALEDETRHIYPRGRDVLALPRRLCQAAESEGERYDRAADYCLAGVRYGEMFQRGGTTSHCHVGWQMQSEAVAWLAEHRDRVSTAKAEETIRVIERSFAQREHPSVIAQRDWIYGERSRGWSGRLAYVFAAQPAARTTSHLAIDQLEADMRLSSLAVLYAIRLFQDEQRRLPTDLKELTPALLSQVPLDSFSGRPFIYRPSISDFQLYSVGRDGKDDGGKFDPRSYYRDSGYDLDLTFSK